MGIVTTIDYRFVYTLAIINHKTAPTVFMLLHRKCIESESLLLIELFFKHLIIDTFVGVYYISVVGIWGVRLSQSSMIIYCGRFILTLNPPSWLLGTTLSHACERWNFGFFIRSVALV